MRTLDSLHHNRIRDPIRAQGCFHAFGDVRVEAVLEPQANLTIGLRCDREREGRVEVKWERHIRDLGALLEAAFT